MSANGKRVALVEILAREITVPYLAAGVLDDTTMRATTDLGRAAARRVLDKLDALAASEAGVQGGGDDERRAGLAARAALDGEQGEADAASAKTPASVEGEREPTRRTLRNVLERVHDHTMTPEFALGFLDALSSHSHPVRGEERASIIRTQRPDALALFAVLDDAGIDAELRRAGERWKVWFPRADLERAADLAPQGRAHPLQGAGGGEREIPMYAARDVPADSWLRQERFGWFMRGLEYAATQTRAIPALAAVDPHDLYFATWAIMRGAGLPDPEASVECPCRRCVGERERDVPLWERDARFFACATCGNKRCPHATDHRHACTGSNEPGQPGSVFGGVDAPTPLAED